MFSRKEWVDTPFCEADVRRNTIATTDLRASRAPQGPPPECRSPAGFRRVSGRPRGRDIRLRWATRAGGPVRIDVFRLTRGSRMTRSRRVGRFTARAGLDGANFRGRRLRGDGVFVVRLRARGVFGGTDTRRLGFRRVRGRFRALPRFERVAGCDLLRSFRLSAPVFGRRGLRASFRLTEGAQFTLHDGSRRLFGGRARSGTFRVRSRRRGLHRFRLTIRSGGRTVRVTLRGRRL
jgi:hypothetical protein